jgi:hypothetical protein
MSVAAAREIVTDGVAAAIGAPSEEIPSSRS